MTREEAVMTINFLKEDYEQLLTEEDAEALDMAVEALKQVTGKLNNPDDSLLTADPEACKEQKSKLDLAPSANRPRPIGPIITVDLESGVVPRSACEPKGPKTIIYADRPKGEWIESREQNILMAKRIEKGETWRVCSNCGTGYMIGAQYEGQKSYGERFHNFCPRCGADMRTTKGVNTK